MNTTAKLELLLDYYNRNRGVGHTLVLIEGLRHCDQAIVLGHNMDWASRLARDTMRLGKAKIGCLCWSMLHEASLHTVSAPLAIDNSFMWALLEDTLKEISRLGEKIAQREQELLIQSGELMLAKRQLQDAQVKIDVLKNDLAVANEIIADYTEQKEHMS